MQKEFDLVVFGATGFTGRLVAEYLQQAWTAIGLHVELESQEWKTFVADTRAGNYELARFGNIGNFPDTESEFLANFRCKSPDNRAQWCDPEFEALMDAARPIADRTLRNAKIHEAEDRLLQSAPVIPIYVYTQKRLVRPYVRDLAVNLIDMAPIERAWLDPDWKAHR